MRTESTSFGLCPECRAVLRIIVSRDFRVRVICRECGYELSHENGNNEKKT